MINIKSLVHHADTGVVTEIHWEVVVTDQGHEAREEGVTPLPSPPYGSDFILLSELTKERVENWLNHLIDVEEITTRLGAELGRKLKPEYVRSLPWQPPDDESIDWGLPG